MYCLYQMTEMEELTKAEAGGSDQPRFRPASGTTANYQLNTKKNNSNEQEYSAIYRLKRAVHKCLLDNIYKDILRRTFTERISLF